MKTKLTLTRQEVMEAVESYFVRRIMGVQGQVTAMNWDDIFHAEVVFEVEHDAQEMEPATPTAA